MINLKKNGKKGFTLAELLIVVAIIAVLTAIAVPLFVGALNNAEERVGKANIRVVRGMAVDFILESNPTEQAFLYDTSTKKLKDKFYVSATVDETGNVSALTFAKSVTGSEENKAIKNKDGGYDVSVLITANDLTGAEATA